MIWFASTGAMVSVTSEDLPDPETPVTTVSVPYSTFADTLLRLFAVQPKILKAPRRGFLRFPGSSIMRLPVRYAPVSESGFAMISAGVPAATTSPPSSPAPGPMSIT